MNFYMNTIYEKCRNVGGTLNGDGVLTVKNVYIDIPILKDVKMNVQDIKGDFVKKVLIVLGNIYVGLLVLPT